MLDVTLMQVMKYRKQYEKLSGLVSRSSLDNTEVTSTILKYFGEFFKEFKDYEQINKEVFMSWLLPKIINLKQDFFIILKRYIHKVWEDPPEEIFKSIVNNLLDMQFAEEVANKLEGYGNGDEINIVRTVAEIAKGMQEAKIRTENKAWIPHSDIDSLLKDLQVGKGFTWPIKAFNESMRQIIGGDFIIFAARPDVGKTSLLADILTYMAPQIPFIYPDEERVIWWFNNEGAGKRIVTRTYQAALHEPMSKLLSLHEKNELVPRYKEAVGDIDIIRICDVHGASSHELEEILEETKPALIVFDMLDNVKYTGAKEGSRTDQVLESLYQWARNLGIKHDVPVFATSQMSADAEGLCWPTQQMLKDSKTGKQGAADVIIMIGKSNDVGLETMRFAGLVKNKLHQENFPKDPRAELFFDGIKCKFEQQNTSLIDSER